MGFLNNMIDMLTSAYDREDRINIKRGFALETNIGKLFSLFADGLEDVKQQAELVRLWDDLDYAEGKVLDRYGANFGVKRTVADDSIYRLAIRVKMVAQLSGGDVDTVLEAATALLDVDIGDVQIEELFPAKVKVSVDWAKLSQTRQDTIEDIAWAIKRILAGGVGFRLFVRTYRTYRQEINQKRFAFGNTHLTAPPIGEDRHEVFDLEARTWAHWQTSLSAAPAGEDRVSELDLNTRMRQTWQSRVTGAYPGEDREGTTDATRSRGAYYHTHLKSNYIE